MLRLAQQPVLSGAYSVPESYIVKTVYDGNYIYADVDGVKEKGAGKYCGLGGRKKQ